MIAMEYVTNIIGIALMIMVLVTNRNHSTKTGGFKYLKCLIFVTIASCICEILLYAFDGKPGNIFTIVLYLLSFWSFLSNILMAYFWIKLECSCIGVVLPKKIEVPILVLDGIGVLSLLVNFFYPIVFKYDQNNVYQRCDYFWIALAIGGLNIIFALIIYFVTLKKGRLLIPFRMGLFVIPLITGIVVQTMFYGVTVIWVGVAIGVSGMASSLKDRLIYLDALTGVYNRTFLDRIADKVNGKEISTGTGLMIDVNDFKAINDNFGHNVGDKALIEITKIFTKAVGNYGSVIRSGGDEFIILLHSTDQSVVEKITNNINVGCEQITKTNREGYKLSVSIGCSIQSKAKQNFDEFITELDHLMYEKKQEYHRLNNTSRG